MNVKSKFAVGVLVLATVGGGGFLVARQVAEREGEADFQEQLRLARLEGLPTTPAEFDATLPKVSSEENAAPIYRELGKMNLGSSTRMLDNSFLWEPSKESLSSAKSALKNGKDALELIEAATAKPKCIFDWNWNDGFFDHFPESVTMKNAAKVLAIRGRLSAVEGDHVSALADAEAILKIASHIDDHYNSIGYATKATIHQIGLHFLATLAVRFPDRTAYRQELEDAVAKWESPRLQPTARGDLLEILKTIKDHEKEVQGDDGKEPPIHLSLRAKANVVRAIRKHWASLEAPESARSDLIRQAARDLGKALEDAPSLAELYDGIFGYYAIEYLDRYAHGRLAYEALLRALRQPTLPKTIKTDDLLSPSDKKPVTYQYEKGRILIEVSRSTSDWPSYRLKIGPPAKSAP